jgi:Fe-S-cluster containining protein
MEWEYRKRVGDVMIRKHGDKAAQAWRDELYIADMLVHKHTITHPHGLRGRHGHPVKGSRHHYYTCRHFDGTNCTDYENRPKMCSEYPHYGRGEACQYPKCTWHDGKYPNAKDVRGTRISSIEMIEQES